MILSQSDLAGLVIVLGSSLLLLLIMLYANVQLVKQNRFLKRRLRMLRKLNHDKAV